jgi:peptide/nickel transport system substrate-binding protein
MKNDSRRDFLHQAILVGGGTLILGACSSGGSGSGKRPVGGDVRLGAGLPTIEGGKVITDPALMPTEFHESPAFAQMVAAGKLPPVKERIGSDPLVIKPVHSTGKYGGEIRRAYISVGDVQNANRFCAGPDSLLYWDYEFDKVIPNLARDFELNKDKTVLTLHLRRGMKWSDGHPFTADDIIFWYEDIYLNKEISGTGELGKTRIEKVDDYTVQYISPAPQPLLPNILASTSTIGGQTLGGKTGQGGFAPKHYLSKFHPKYTSKDEATKLAKAAGLSNWSLYLLRQNDWSLNTELPTLTPWTTTRPINKSPWTFEAKDHHAGRGQPGGAQPPRGGG